MVISTLFFTFLFTVNTKPYSVPTKYLLGPASLLYSKEVPPTNSYYYPSAAGVSTIFNYSIGPYSNFLKSHHKHLPSVEVVTHSLPNLWAIQWK